MFHGPSHDSHGDSEGMAAARWNPMPSRAGALLLSGSALCQPGPHQERWAQAWAWMPKASTATALSSNRAVGRYCPVSATASSRPPTCMTRCGPSSSPVRNSRLLPGVASSPKPESASERPRTVNETRPPCCACSSACTNARASDSAGGNAWGNASSARCTASRGKGHWLTVNCRPPSSTSTSMALRAERLGVQGTEAAKACPDRDNNSTMPQAAHACAAPRRGRPAPVQIDSIHSTLNFLVRSSTHVVRHA